MDEILVPVEGAALDFGVLEVHSGTSNMNESQECACGKCEGCNADTRPIWEI
jgi:hypothetical protein